MPNVLGYMYMYVYLCFFRLCNVTFSHDHSLISGAFEDSSIRLWNLTSNQSATPVQSPPSCSGPDISQSCLNTVTTTRDNDVPNNSQVHLAGDFSEDVQRKNRFVTFYLVSTVILVELDIECFELCHVLHVWHVHRCVMFAALAAVALTAVACCEHTPLPSTRRRFRVINSIYCRLRRTLQVIQSATFNRRAPLFGLKYTTHVWHGVYQLALWPH